MPQNQSPASPPPAATVAPTVAHVSATRHVHTATVPAPRVTIPVVAIAAEEHHVVIIIAGHDHAAFVVITDDNIIAVIIDPNAAPVKAMTAPVVVVGVFLAGMAGAGLAAVAVGAGAAAGMAAGVRCGVSATTVTTASAAVSAGKCG